MTCIATFLAGRPIPSKKALKERVLTAPATVLIQDPSIFQPRTFYVDEMQVGQVEVCTNHPKRSWFAQIERTSKGFKVT